MQFANTDCYMQFSGLDHIPRQYMRLVHHTQEYIDVVRTLCHMPGTFSNAATLLVGFSDNLLRPRNSSFEFMLNSQRGHIYWMLDDALLRLCLIEWERPSSDSTSQPAADMLETPWTSAILPLHQRITMGMETIPDWPYERRKYYPNGKSNCAPKVSEFREWMEAYYFVRTRKLLNESGEVYWIRRKVNACLMGRLPVEVAEKVIDELLELESLPKGSLRMRYFPKGKGRVS